MKVLTILSSVLILQSSASFFDEFSGAVTTVESSFGKLLNDVIYDVKETIDCTLLAVEQVLSLGMLGDQSAYDSRCKDAQVEQPAAAVEPEPASSEQEMFTLAPIPVLTSRENRQIGSSILNVDEVLCDVLNKDDAHAQLETVKLALQNETERLTQISDLLRRQLEELSNEVKQKFKSIELQTSEPSVESIWNNIIILHEIEHRHKNTAEARKISHLLDQILDILDANEEDRTDEDDYKIKEIMRKLSKQSKDGSGKLWKDADDYPKDFREYANKLFAESQATSSSENSTEKPHSITNEKGKPEGDEKKGKPVSDVTIEKLNIKKDEEKPKTDDEKENPKEVTTVKPKQKKRKRITTTTTERPLTIEELAAQYGSLFDVMPDTASIDKTPESTNNMIEDSRVNEMVMKSLDELESNKDAQDIFDMKK